MCEQAAFRAESAKQTAKLLGVVTHARRRPSLRKENETSSLSLEEEEEELLAGGAWPRARWTTGG